MTRRLIAVVGATASGKTELAIRLAERLGGEVVNADSRQVYRGMDIGTAKPTADERARVPHLLFDIADPRDEYSLALYRAQALAALEEVWERGKTPIVAGGTGQYIWALLEGWTVPEVAPDGPFRQELREFAEREGVEALHRRLVAVDPVAGERIDARNVRRVIRALEVHAHTGQPISEAQAKCGAGFDWAAVGIDVPREELDRRINRRTEAMFGTGFVEEVRALLDSGVAPDAPAMSSIGYRVVVSYLADELTLEEAVALTAQATRRLARRQAAWFRRSDERIRWVGSVEEGVAVAER
ncbi:MAG TPA: tRNA (adenosine(37)-N6)-dimethylallyltransferase MiaA [Tepidiformaceae bacterium]|nr:tRNA (adenosine(37)-N6)-dimethylallyltransferase MiaA [Tepidiformaceae bacterium]